MLSSGLAGIRLFGMGQIDCWQVPRRGLCAGTPAKEEQYATRSQHACQSGLAALRP